MLRIMTALTATTALIGPAAVLDTPRPARPPGTTTSRPDDDFGWPVRTPHRVVREFTPPETEFGPGHRGVDLALPAGAPILAAGDGIVVHAGPLAGRGVISIEHPNGLRTTYEPVTAEVAEGDRVTRGQRIGRLDPGHPECAARGGRACLHWGAKRGEGYVDPLRLLGHGAVRLLPWTSPPGTGDP